MRGFSTSVCMEILKWLFCWPSSKEILSRTFGNSPRSSAKYAGRKPKPPSLRSSHSCSKVKEPVEAKKYKKNKARSFSPGDSQEPWIIQIGGYDYPFIYPSAFQNVRIRGATHSQMDCMDGTWPLALRQSARRGERGMSMRNFTGPTRWFHLRPYRPRSEAPRQYPLIPNRDKP